MKKKLIAAALVVVWIMLCAFDYGPRYKLAIAAVDNNAAIYMLGDSRTVMGAADTGYDARANWYARSGSTISYLNETIAPILDTKDLAGKKIVIMYGVNDVMQFGAAKAGESYYNFLLTKGEQWVQKGAKVYFCSVLGITKDIENFVPGLNSDAMNAQIDSFNSFMRTNLPPGITYVQLQHYYPIGYDDGLHFTADESYIIYENVINTIAAIQ